MKIAIIDRYYNHLGIRGGFARASLLASALIEKGHEVHLICERTKFFNYLIDVPGLIEHTIAIKRRNLGFDNLLFGREAAKIVDELKPDVIDLHGMAALYFALTGRPYFATVHDTAIDWAQIREKPLRNRITAAMYYPTDLIVYRAAQHCIAISDYVRDRARREYGLRKIETVYTPIDTRMFKRSCYEPIVLYVGKLDHRKGADTFLKAIPKIKKEAKDARFVVVGTGLLKEQFRKNKDIEYLDILPYAEVVKQYSRASIAVCPSTQQGFALAPIEAQAAAVPVIVSNVGGLKEELVEGKTGYAIAPRDADALAEKAIEMLSDKKKLKQMGSNARQFAKKFDARKQAEKLLKIFKGHG